MCTPNKLYRSIREASAIGQQVLKVLVTLQGKQEYLWVTSTKSVKEHDWTKNVKEHDWTRNVKEHDWTRNVKEHNWAKNVKEHNWAKKSKWFLRTQSVHWNHSHEKYPRVNLRSQVRLNSLLDHNFYFCTFFCALRSA